MDAGSRLARSAAFAMDVARRARVQVRRSPGLAVVSLLIGIALWVLVTAEENPTRTDFVPAPVPVAAVNLDPQLAVANALPSLQVRVAAPADRWNTLSPNNFRAFVDLNGLQARDQQVPVRVDVVGVTQVRVIEVLPSTVTVNLEQLVTKSVKVTSGVVGTLPRGYQLGDTVPDLPTADVSGPKSLVDLVSQASATINVTGLTTTLDQTVALTPIADGGGEIRGVTLRPATAKVSIVVVQDLLTRTLPLAVDLGGQPAPGYRVTGVRVTPVSITVSGSIDVLQAVDTLQLPRVDVSGQQTDMHVNARVTAPEGMVSAISSATVDVSIAPIAGSIALTLAPELTGVHAGLTARATPGSVEVTLDGPLPKLNAIPAGGIHATVDASALNVGTTDARVVVSVPDGVSVRDVQPATVSVTLTRP